MSIKQKGERFRLEGGKNEWVGQGVCEEGKSGGECGKSRGVCGLEIEMVK